MKTNSIYFDKLETFSDTDGIMFIGLTIPDDEIEETAEQIEAWFKEIGLISKPGVEITGIHKLLGNVLGEEGRTDWFIEWNKPYMPNPMVRLRYASDIKWVQDFIDNYKNDYKNI